MPELVACHTCRHERGYYSDAWCELGKEIHSIMHPVICEDYEPHEHRANEKKKEKSKQQYEIEYVGYMKFEDKKEAQEFAYELEDILGYITRNDCNLYCSKITGEYEVKETEREIKTLEEKIDFLIEVIIQLTNYSLKHFSDKSKVGAILTVIEFLKGNGFNVTIVGEDSEVKIKKSD